MTKIYKSIAYAYPTSPAAKELGYNDTGCYYVTTRNVGGIATRAHNCEGYLQPNDSDLLAFFNETEGDICPMFLKYANPEVKKLLGI